MEAGRERSDFFLRYLKSHIRNILLYLIFCVIFAAVFALYHLPLAAVGYPAFLCAALGLAVFWRESRRACIKHRQMQNLMKSRDACGDGHLSFYLQDMELLPPADGIAEADYRQLLGLLMEEQNRRTMLQNRRYEDMIDYYTVWAHQIKTPIAAIRLNIQNEDSELSRLVAEDLQRIEQYVEMVMAFLRLDSDTTDYLFRPCDLDEIIRQAVRRFAGQFIRRGLKLDYEPVCAVVVTDEKWLCFVIEQILSNALKYTRTGGIRIWLEAPRTLCIRDSGIGIAPEDLPRIFEKGYTGCNGRADKKASGLGLYLCRRIMENLGCVIRAESEAGVGTTIRLDLWQGEGRPE